MPDEESLYPSDWLRLAERDLNRVQLLVLVDPELAGFCLQQAVEKFLKAFLLSHSWQLRRIHNLDALLDDAITFDASLEEFREACQKITAFYMLERYPLLADGGMSGEDISAAFEEVRGLIERLRTGSAE